MFFQPDEFTVLQDSYAIQLKDGELNVWNSLFFIAALEKVIRKYYDWSNKAGWNKIKELSISLPSDKLGRIDFDAIESCVQEIEQERIREINAYIQVSGFDECSLNSNEIEALSSLDNRSKECKLIALKDLFDINGTKSLDEGALTFIPEGINFVGRVYENNGVKGHLPKQTFEPNEPNTITATVIGNYKYVKYQEKPYYCSQNINKLTPKFKIDLDIALFFIAHIQKFVETYNGQQGGYKLPDIQNHLISVPVTDDGSVDYAFMENYINAIKKQTIARVKEYIDSEYKTEEPAIEPTIIPLQIHDDYQPGRIPLYTLRAACGYFDDGQLPEAEGWIDATGLGFTPDKGRYFAVHAKGDSMLPKIHDGDICIFEWYHAGSRNGEIVLTESSEYDEAYGGRYTIKRYHSEKTVTDEGWQHAKVELQPINPNFDTIELDGENYRTIGIFKCTLG